MEHGPIQLVQFVRFLDGLGDGWVAVAVFGVLAGFLARFITAREARVGLLSACLLGVAGALLGFFVARRAGFALEGSGLRFLAAFAGSLLIAIVGGLVLDRRKRAD